MRSLMWKWLISFLSVCFGGLVVHAQTVSEVAACQRYPWNNLVDIEYTLEGMPETGNYTVEITVEEEKSGRTYTAESFDRIPPSGNGSHHLIWNPEKDGISLVSDSVVFRVTVWENPVYMVVDLLSNDPYADPSEPPVYEVSYLNDVPEGGWTDEYKSEKLVLRRIPAGTFTMGSPSREMGRSSGENPHQVTLTSDFYLGVFEVTQSQWERVMGSPKNPSYFKGALRPVERVGYRDIRGCSAGARWPSSAGVDASSFMGRLREGTGLSGFDLPTEAQWEYACRAGSVTALNSGKDLTARTGTCPNLSELARYDMNSKENLGGYTNAHTAVGMYKPNSWGLYDMHGNVYEWCLDWYGKYGQAVTDPEGPASGSQRVIRGGAWFCNARYCRSAFRHSKTPAVKYDDYGVGFRVGMFERNGEDPGDPWEPENGEDPLGPEDETFPDSGFEPSELPQSTELASDSSEPVRMDIAEQPKWIPLNHSQQITYSPFWDGVGNDTVSVYTNGILAVSKASEAGIYEWTPDRPGVYRFSCTWGKKGYEAVLIAHSTVLKDVVARQRYPWNNLVDIDYTLENILDGTNCVVEVEVEDPASGTVTEIRGIDTRPVLINGRNRLTWDFSKEKDFRFSPEILFNLKVMPSRSNSRSGSGRTASGEGLARASSAPIGLVRVDGPFSVQIGSTNRLTYSNLWDGNPEEPCVLSENGRTVVTLMGEGKRPWIPSEYGRYILTHLVGSLEYRAVFDIPLSAWVGDPFSHLLPLDRGTPPCIWSEYTETNSVRSSFVSKGSSKGWKANDRAWAFTLPFDFPFYGETSSTLFVGSNGTLSFAQEGAGEGQASIGKLKARRMIAPLWADLDLSRGGIYILSQSDSVMFRWKGYYRGTNHPVHFSATLHRDGRILFSYGKGNQKGGLIAISAGSKTRFLPAAGAKDNMESSNDILLTPALLPPGLSITPDGTVEGIPQRAGRYPVSVTVMDAASNRYDEVFILDVFDRYALDVRSEHGMPNPPAGSHLWTSGEEYSVGVYGIDPPEPEGTRYFCTGWSGTGSVPNAGGGTNLTFKLEKPSSITWNWRKEYLLSADVSGSGEVRGKTGWITEGITVKLEAASTNPYATFSGWEGDIEEGESSTPSITVLMDRPRSIKANFSATSLPFTVESSRDPVWPARGTNWVDRGSIQTSRVDRIVPAGTGTRYVSTGWTGTGSVPPTGTDTNFTFMILEGSSVVWNWRKEYLLSTNVAGIGWVEGTADWIEAGSDTILYAKTDALHEFAGWEGEDIGDCETRGTRIFVPVNKPYRITAKFVPLFQEFKVYSAYGTPYPETGTYSLEKGSVLNPRISPTSLPVGSRTNYVCSGWSGKGSVPADGTDHETTFTLMQDSSITWNWQTNYLITVKTDGRGFSDFTEGWVERGTVLTVNVSRVENCIGLPLTGDTDGVAVEDGKVLIPCDRTRSIVISFDILTLPEALNAPYLKWETSGTNGLSWTPQTAISVDGVGAAVSKSKVPGWLKTTVEGPCILTFSWKSAGGTGGLDFSKDNIYQCGIVGEKEWSSRSIHLEEGTHELVWESWSDSTNTEHTCYLDQVLLETPKRVPYTWLRQFDLVPDGNYAAAADKQAKNGLFVWECYVADLDPKDPNSRFRVNIEMVNGKPEISWTPNNTNRCYTVEGCGALGSGAWRSPCSETDHFFRVRVDLPPREEKKEK